jgi:nucleotide-binding universal stress UspA family protein
VSISLILPFDGLPAAERAVELLAGYSGDPANLRPLLFNAQPRSRNAGAAVLEPAAARLAAAGIAVQQQTRVGRPAPVILREARRQQAGAVVMGTRGTGALQGFAFGSTALRVVHRARSPVILVKPEDRLPAALGRRLRVLLAMDGSEPAARAAERLVAWRGWLGELEVHLAWVQQPLTYLETVLPPHDDVMQQWSTTEGEQATQAARDAFGREGIAHHLHLTIGDPALEVRALAEQTGAELVVLGTRGRGAAHHALVGSVALKVAVLGSVPALLVP